MKRVVINALLAFILMLIQTSVASSFGLLSVCQFGILASVVSSALAFPTMSTSISMLLLGLAFDLWVSGPPFLYAFLFVIAHDERYRRLYQLVSGQTGSGKITVQPPQTPARTPTGQGPTARSPARSPTGISVRSAAGRIRTIRTSNSATARSAMGITATASTISTTTSTSPRPRRARKRNKTEGLP